MSEETHDERNPATEHKTPLDLVHEQQSRQQKSKEVLNQRPESDAELPGHGVPSDMRKHPQRQHYGNERDR